MSRGTIATATALQHCRAAAALFVSHSPPTCTATCTPCSFQFSQMSRRTGISSSPLRLSTSLAAGGAAEKAAIIFRNHDVNQKEEVSCESAHQMCTALGPVTWSCTVPAACAPLDALKELLNLFCDGGRLVKKGWNCGNLLVCSSVGIPWGLRAGCAVVLGSSGGDATRDWLAFSRKISRAPALRQVCSGLEGGVQGVQWCWDPAGIDRASTSRRVCSGLEGGVQGVQWCWDPAGVTQSGIGWPFPGWQIQGHVLT
eukprot:1157298-Pelagomonas_calceolata.AAC.20